MWKRITQFFVRSPITAGSHEKDASHSLSLCLCHFLGCFLLLQLPVCTLAADQTSHISLYDFTHAPEARIQELETNSEQALRVLVQPLRSPLRKIISEYAAHFYFTLLRSLEDDYFLIDLEEVDVRLAELMRHFEDHPYLTSDAQRRLLTRTHFLCAINALALNEQKKAEKYTAYYKASPFGHEIDLSKHAQEVREFIESIQPQSSSMTSPSTRTSPVPTKQFQSAPDWVKLQITMRQAIEMKPALKNFKLKSQAVIVYAFRLRNTATHYTPSTKTIYLLWDPRRKAIFKAVVGLKQPQGLRQILGNILNRPKRPTFVASESGTLIPPNGHAAAAAPLVTNAFVSSSSESRNERSWLRRHWYVPAIGLALVGGLTGFLIYENAQDRNLTVRLPLRGGQD